MSPARFPRLVLFDLDGTLLDSAPDFVATINVLRAERGEPPLAVEALRPQVSKGARAMLESGFPRLDAQAREAMIPALLAAYQGLLAKHGAAFDGIGDLLAAIEQGGSRWGIVTNKPEYLAKQLLPLLGWESRCSVLVGGDTLAVRKPDPRPLLHAAQLLDVHVHDCAYVGDDQRDIAAARAAGMRSVVALWGYRPEGDEPAEWGGDATAERPADLLDPANWPQP